MMNKSKTTARKHKSSIVSQMLSEITPVEKLQANTKMTLAARLEDLINSRGWSKTEFANKVNKNPSEITKWLSGTQNFTLDTLAEIALALNMPIADLFAPKQVQVINKVHVVITIKEVPSSIKYVTPISGFTNEWPNVFTGYQFNAVLPITSRMQYQA